MYFEILLAFTVVASAGGTICFSDDKVYFHAWVSATKSYISGGTTIVFDQTLTNRGNGYNKRTGKFTAPRKGAYVFTWTAVAVGKHYISLHLIVKGKDVSLAQADGGRVGGQNGSGTNTVVVKLRKGDEVYLKCGRWGGTAQHQLYGDRHTTFSGWMI